MDKQNLRKQLKQKRLALSKETYEAMSLSCFENIKTILSSIPATSIGIYISMNQEVDTKRIIEYLWSIDKNVYVPKCKMDGVMTFHQINSWEDVAIGKYGILEPISNQNSYDEIDVMMIPLIAFNQEGYRLGMGGGYYDRYIPRCSSMNIGLAFSFQKSDFIQENHDIKFHVVVTEKEVIYF